MTINRPELTHLGIPDLQMRATHKNHMSSQFSDFLDMGRDINQTGRQIGAEAVMLSGTFGESMLSALDRVSAYQQFASSLNQAAIIDPDSVDVHDVTIAQAQANMALNITRNVLNRLVQGWRDIINTR